MLKELYRGFIILFLFTILTGLIYPLFITLTGSIVFKDHANGSLIKQDGIIIGSILIGQNFTAPRYFWGRPSATNPPYNPLVSAASNLGPLNPELFSEIKARVSALHAADPTQVAAVPIDLVTTSASGLDPDISVLSAQYQAPRIARLRHLNLDAVNALIAQNTIMPQFGFFGQARVNVLKLNLALDQVAK